MQKRLLESIVFDKEYGRQMRFIAGPRQCGKTTIAKTWLNKHKSENLYFNWDDYQIRSRFRDDPSFFYQIIKDNKIKDPWICFDEIHKMIKWKNFLKAHFDNNENNLHTIVTGSAKLDMFRRSGDSLAGRYFLFHLYPFTLSELKQRNLSKEADLNALDWIESRLDLNHEQKQSQSMLQELLNFSGFPEPLTRSSSKFHKIWSQNYLERIVFEDLRDLTNVKNLDAIANLIKLLPGTVSNPVSINALREDLELNHETVKNYLKYLNLAYVVFQLKPYHKRLRYSVKKEEKLYFYDWTKVADLAAKFENFVALELMVMTQFWTDAGFAQMELFYLRQKNRLESDFLIVKDSEPWLIVEVKLSKIDIDSHHYNSAEKLGDLPVVQVILEGNAIIKKNKNGFVIPAARLF